MVYPSRIGRETAGSRSGPIRCSSNLTKADSLTLWFSKTVIVFIYKYVKVKDVFLSDGDVCQNIYRPKWWRSAL